ncbi:hypothetical protein [Chitinophaga pinensis]|uniref:Uncharacterized protein n=1 Tax=Chitinophaga pinensis TaxID=79329 RepID=A0A5C6LR88_9BACT|nr:hypothetical protein [Chitinophaga pinensis]TWV99107.1 hypothetical protein FEF09_17660 [Chitinophaga pinensis]
MVATGCIPESIRKDSLFGELGYNRYYRAGLAYMQAYITIHKNVVLNPGYLYFIYKRPGQPYGQEHFVMPAVIFQIPVRKILIEDRNMLWNRIRTIMRLFIITETG